MTTKEQTCEERIAAQMKGREEYLAALYKIQDSGKGGTVDGEEIDADDAYDRVAELPLSVEVRRVLRIDISTGGPADYITAELDGTEVQSVAYHFADWFDHAERHVPEDSPLWRLAEYYAEIV